MKHSNLSKRIWPILAGSLLIVLSFVMFSGWMGGWLMGCGTLLVGAGLILAGLPKTTSQKEGVGKSSSMTDAPARISRQVHKMDPKAFKKQVRELESQALRMEKKTRTLDEALNRYFGDSRISYEKFVGTINSVVGVFEENVSRTIARIEIFDEDGYDHLFRTHQEYTDAIVPYQKIFEQVEQDLHQNEEILQRMDQLLAEVNHLQASQQNLADLPAMKELAQLIDQARLYQQNQSGY